MFNFVREKRWVVFAILACITLSFALWGVSSYDLSGQSAGVVATVNGSKITQQEFDATLRQQQNRMREQLGENFDAALLDTPEMRRSMMDNLITQRLLIERAKAARLVVTDAQMAEVIGSIEAFQEGGKFDSKRYVAVLSNNNMSPLLYETRLRDELLGQQMQETYAENGYAPNSVVENIFRLNQQQRTVSVSPVSLQAFTAQAKVDEAATKKYYDQHQSEFQVPEQARVEFVKLSTNNLMDKIEIKPEEARNYYQQHLSDFGAPEQRQAAHILINMSFAASQAEQDAARDKAAQLLKQVKQNPAKFAEIAKLNSQDTGSAVQGGDLGFFGRGMMVKPFEEAAFSLKVGDISELVRSDFGYHIIKLIAVKPSRTLPFDEARTGIVNKLREQKAADQLAELADKFSNTVYEQSDTLKPAAALADAKIEQSGWLSKGAATAEPWTAKMLQAIFNDEVVKNKRNTVAIEVTPNVLVAARMLEHKPAAALPFSIAQEAIRQKLLRQQALELAVKQGKMLLEQLQHGNKPVLSWGAAQSVTRMQHGSLDEGMIKQIFRADAVRLPQYVGAETAQDGYVLVRIDAAKEGEAISDAKRDQYARQLRQLIGETLFQSYLAEAKQQAKIEVSLPEKNTEKTTE